MPRRRVPFIAWLIQRFLGPEWGLIGHNVLCKVCGGPISNVPDRGPPIFQNTNWWPDGTAAHERCCG